jgi:hypothetical protein
MLETTHIAFEIAPTSFFSKVSATQYTKNLQSESVKDYIVFINKTSTNTTSLNIDFNIQELFNEYQDRFSILLPR